MDHKNYVGLSVERVDKKTGSQTRVVFPSTFLFYHGLSV